MDEDMIKAIQHSIAQAAGDRTESRDLSRPSAQGLADVLIGVWVRNFKEGRLPSASPLAVSAAVQAEHLCWQTTITMIEEAARRLTMSDIRGIEAHEAFVEHNDELGMGLFSAIRNIVRVEPNPGARTHLGVRALAPLIWYSDPVEDASVWVILLDRLAQLLALNQLDTVRPGPEPEPGAILSWAERLRIAFIDLKNRPALVSVPTL